jgi:Flp pilus assembly protein TadB
MRAGAIRASDEDREDAAQVLRRHAIAGRLTFDELDERLGRAFRARTLRELDTLLSDLPRRRGRAHAPAQTVLMLLLRGLVTLVVGLVIVTVAILLALAWAGSRLVAAVAARSLDQRRVRALRTGP